MLIQGWCFQKSLSTVPKSEKYAIERSNTLRAHDVTSNLVLVCFEIGRNFAELFTKWFPKWTATFQTQTVQTDFLFKNLFILDILNVLGLKNSTDFKEIKQYYTILPIFEHFGR